MKTKSELIQEYLAKPIQVGEDIIVKGLSLRNPEMTHRVTVTKITNDEVYFMYDIYEEALKRKISDVTKDTSHIGANPFKAELKGVGYNIDIWQLMYRFGWEEDRENREWKKKDIEYYGAILSELSFNPVVIDVNGNEVEYQRGLVWTLEQKQLLIDSIYNQIEIGKFVIRKRSAEWARDRVNKGLIKNTAFSDLVDGKQRFNAILEFIQNKFVDSYGNKYSDLSHRAQRKFINYRQLTYVELDENSTDKDILNVFLAINFTGVPMSREHIEYVKTIQI